MNNDEIVKKLVREYGREKVLTFCRINAFKHMLKSLEFGIPATNPDHEESKWWLKKAEELDLKPVNDY